MFAPREADLAQYRHALAVTFGAADAAIDQRQFDVFQRGGALEEIEPLEHEAEIVPAQQRALVAAEGTHIGAAEEIMAAGRRIEAAQNVHSCRLARARGAHHGDELAVINRKVDPGQRRDLGLAGPVDFGDLAKLDERDSGHVRASPASWRRGR